MIKNSKHIFRGLQYGALALPYYRRDAINTRSPAWRFLQLETYFPLCMHSVELTLIEGIHFRSNLKIAQNNGTELSGP